MKESGPRSEVSEEIVSAFQRLLRSGRSFEVCLSSCNRSVLKPKGPFTIDRVKLEDLQAGKLTASWTLGARHSSFTDDQADQVAKMKRTVLIGTLLGSAKGAWDVSDEFNRLLPDYQFTQTEDFLTAVWEGRP